MSTTTTAERVALYRLSDAEGVLLYIGITSDPDARMASHRYTKSWWTEVAETTVEWFDDRESARAAEIKAIASEGARYNKDGSPLYSRKIAVPEGAMSIADFRNKSAEVIVKSRYFGGVTFLMNRGRRVAAIVPVEVGELVEEFGDTELLVTTVRRMIATRNDPEEADEGR